MLYLPGKWNNTDRPSSDCQQCAGYCGQVFNSHLLTRAGLAGDIQEQCTGEQDKEFTRPIQTG